MKAGSHSIFKDYFVLTVVLMFLGGKHMAQYCPSDTSDITIYYWTPKKGNIADFCAETMRADLSKGFIIILGRAAEGIYTIEGGDKSDAGDGRYAYIAFSNYDGTRKKFKLPDLSSTSSGMADTETKEANDKMRSWIWKHFAEQKIDPRELKPLYYSKDRANDPLAMEIKNKDKNLVMSWSLQTESSMCWCLYEWDFSISHE